MASSAPSCTICYESYVESTDICSTKCGHIFHMSCLQQWITKYNKCPMCNENNPQPHRIYLDIALIKEPQEDDKREENIVVVKGVKPSQVTTPLNSLIQQLVVVMQVGIIDEDIKNIIKSGRKEDSAIHVTFKTKYHMELFLKQKHKLKKNPATSQIRIHELLNPEIAALFRYTHKLKDADYKIFYVENKKVYVRKTKNSQPINILTKDQVDDLCLQHTNHCEKPSTSQAHRNNEMSLGLQHANHCEKPSTSQAHRNNEVRLGLQHTNHCEKPSTSQAHSRSTISEETRALYQSSQLLKKYGYDVFIESNNVFVSKTSLKFPNRIPISSEDMIDDLLYIEIYDDRNPYPHNQPSEDSNRYPHNKPSEDRNRYPHSQPNLRRPNDEDTCNIL